MAGPISVQLFAVDPETKERADRPADVIRLARNELVYSYGRHSVRVLDQ
jgi:hypothetical protein